MIDPAQSTLDRAVHRRKGEGAVRASQIRTAIDHLHEWFRDVLHAYERIFKAMTSSALHRRAALYTSAVNSANTLRADDKAPALGHHLRLLAAISGLTGTTPSAKDWRAAVEDTIKGEDAARVIAAKLGAEMAADAGRSDAFDGAIAAFIDPATAKMLGFKFQGPEACAFVLHTGLRRLVRLMRTQRLTGVDMATQRAQQVADAVRAI